MARKQSPIEDAEVKKLLTAEAGTPPDNHPQPIDWRKVKKLAREIVKRDKDLYLEIVHG